MQYHLPIKPIYLGMLVACLVLQACGGSSSTRQNPPEQEPLQPPTSTAATLFANQVGYRTSGTKTLWIQTEAQQSYTLTDSLGATIASGETPQPIIWPPSNQAMAKLDLTSITSTGNYQLTLGNGADVTIKVQDNAWEELHDAALKSYYYNRASTEIMHPYAGLYARALGHPDNQVLVHSSAVSLNRPTGTVISAPKGWYDAGDYNKYVVNSGISTYTLLLSYQHFNNFYAQRSLNIPETGALLPDILSEIQWNLDWLQTMQDPNDGGVYHKLTSLNFNGMEMPDADDDSRYLVQKTTAAALNFSAVMAVAARVYQPFDAAKAATYQAQAVSAYAWAKQNPTSYYQQPSDVSTGEYGDGNVDDEFYWAATELFLTTGDNSFWQDSKAYTAEFSVPSWSKVETLGLYSLLNSGINPAITQQDREVKLNTLIALADALASKAEQNNALDISMTTTDFVWGSNAVVMNQGMVLLNANKLQPNARYTRTAENLLHYVLGVNATGFSFVTGFGEKTPLHVHHRISEADGISAPVPGMLAGGPQNGQQDKCADYPSNQPALSYLDDVCSYSTNEIAINWNAPLVYVLAAFNQP